MKDNIIEFPLSLERQKELADLFERTESSSSMSNMHLNKVAFVDELLEMTTVPLLNQYASHGIDIRDKKFQIDVLDSSKLTLVDFWAEWCGPCKQIGPLLEEIADEKKDKLRVVKLNIDENMNIPQKYGVRGIPTLLLFKKGELVDSKVGSMPKSLLNEWIESFF